MTTADTLLGEGFAELLASEFTGEGGPRAVDMGTVLRGWRRAGGGLRAPLAQDEAIRLAREMGAGLMVNGSIVGLGQRLTVTASVVSVPDAQQRGAATSVSGSQDSIEALLRRVASGLLVQAGGRRRDALQARLTESPVALRSYLEGLAAWRSDRRIEAAAAFERAIAADSTFGRAAFMRWRAAGWINLGEAGPWIRRTWALREHLSAQDRLLLIASLGEHYPNPRTPAQALADRERVAAALPDSPDAHYSLGDYLFHYGPGLGIPRAHERAREALERSLELDSQSTIAAHLAELAIYVGDTTLLRQAWTAYHRLAGIETAWFWGWLVAGKTRDANLLAALRRRPPASVPVGAFSALEMPAMAGVPRAIADELFDHAERHASGNQRFFVAVARLMDAVLRGKRDHRSTVQLDVTFTRFWAVVARLYADGEQGQAEAAGRALSSSEPTDSLELAARSCALSLWNVHHGRPASPDTAFLVRQRLRGCVDVLELERARRVGGPDFDVVLARIDSAVRFRFGSTFGTIGFENVALARAWEQRGNLEMALAAIRRRQYGTGTGLWTEATSLRIEGRLAAQLADTAGAIRAYRRYLVLRSEPDSFLIPQRDSVAAALAVLERR